MLLNWQENFWQQQFAGKAPVPSLLLKGSAGIGKNIFAKYLAQYTLCAQASQLPQPCGTCDSCRWFTAGEHPDFFHLTPQTASDEESEMEKTPSRTSKKKPAASDWIKIAQIREQQTAWLIPPQTAPYRVCLISPAESLQIPAQSALLKILEEPPSWLRFILIAERESRVLPTIRSRCQVFAMPIPHAEDSAHYLLSLGVKDWQTWLAWDGGLPLNTALRFQNIQESGDLSEIECCKVMLRSLASKAGLQPLVEQIIQQGWSAKQLINLLQKIIVDLTQIKMTDQAYYLPSLANELRQAGKSVSLHALFPLWKWLIQQRALQNHPLNAKLWIADLLNRTEQLTAAHYG